MAPPFSIHVARNEGRMLVNFEYVRMVSGCAVGDPVIVGFPAGRGLAVGTPLEKDENLVFYSIIPTQIWIASPTNGRQR